MSGISTPGPPRLVQRRAHGSRCRRELGIRPVVVVPRLHGRAYHDGQVRGTATGEMFDVCLDRDRGGGDNGFGRHRYGRPQGADPEAFDPEPDGTKPTAVNDDIYLVATELRVVGQVERAGRRSVDVDMERLFMDPAGAVVPNRQFHFPVQQIRRFEAGRCCQAQDVLHRHGLTGLEQGAVEDGVDPERSAISVLVPRHIGREDRKVAVLAGGHQVERTVAVDVR